MTDEEWERRVRELIYGSPHKEIKLKIKCLDTIEYRGTSHTCEKEDDGHTIHSCSCGEDWVRDESGNWKPCSCVSGNHPCEAHDK